MIEAMPTVSIIYHGRRGWKWCLLDWGILVADGYERTKTDALQKAREMQKRIFFNQPQPQ